MVFVFVAEWENDWSQSDCLSLLSTYLDLTFSKVIKRGVQVKDDQHIRKHFLNYQWDR